MNQLTQFVKLNDQGNGVADLQRYLESFGYFNNLSAPNVGLFEKTTRQALIEFQMNQGLEPSGQLDEPTLQLMNTPRCGVIDLAEYAIQGRNWGKNDLTYGFLNFTNDLTPNEVRSAIQQALGLWSAVSPLRFTEVPVASNPDIKIMFGSGNHGDSSPFDGPNGVLAHAYYPPPNGGDLAGDAHFDESETWSITVPPGINAYDLVTVAAHEFGHSLGLGHSDVSNALMYAYYNGPHRYLHADDIAGIQTIYAKSSKLIAQGGELGRHLSHAFASVSLMPAYQGWGEAWICHPRANNEIAIECHGAERGKFLSHAYGNIGLQNGYQGAGEAWRFHSLGNNKISIECLGGETGRYLSHAYGNIGLQNGYQGAGEMWANND
jgi:hypothetical protein